MDVSMAVVSTIVNTGQGYAQLEEFAATLNMPYYAPEKPIKSGKIKCCSVKDG